MNQRVQLMPLGDVEADARDISDTFDLRSARMKAFVTADDDGTRPGAIGLPTPKECWEQSVWLHTCIHKVAYYCARQKVSFRYDGGTEIKKHPALDLMYGPNPIMSRFELFYITVAWMNLMGDSFWFLDNGTVTTGRATGLMQPQFIWPISPLDIHPEPDLQSRVPKLKGWRVTLFNGYNFLAAPMEIVQFKFPNPYNIWRGAAPLVTARLATANDVESARHNLKFFKNGARPLGVLETDEDLKDVQRKQMLDSFEARHRGNPHRPALLTMGTKYHETQISNAEMEFSAGRKMNRSEIAAAFGMPPVELGDMDQASYANAREQTSILWRGTLIPVLDLLADSIDHSMLGDDYTVKNIIAYFDLKNVEALKRDLKEQSETAKAYQEMGVPFYMLNEKMELGFDRFKGDDVSLVPNTLVLLDDVINPPEPPPAPTNPNAPPPADPNADPNAQKDFDALVRDVVRTSGILPPANRTPASNSLPNALALARRARANNSPAVQAGHITALEARVAAFAGAAARVVLTPAYAELLQKMLLVIEADKQTLKEFSEPYFRQATGVGIKEMNSLVSGDFSIDSPNAIAFIQNKVVRVTQIQDYQKELITDAVSIMFEEGGSFNDLYTDLVDVFNFTSSRARMIARNEIADGASGGRFLTMQAEGVERHEWVAEKDDRVRETHSEADGAEAAVGEVFEITECRYPHDPEGPAEETIQCRCITLPILDGQRMFEIGSAARDANWDGFVRGWTPIKIAYQRRLKRMFKEERDTILALVKAAA